MNATLSKKLRFSDVVYAINSTPKALRLWLQRGLVEIDTVKPKDGGWTEYSFFDVGILALVRALVNFGVDVPTAGVIANKIMSGHFFPLGAFKDSENVSAGALALVWTNRRIYLSRDGDDAWDMKLVDLWESNLGLRKVAASNPYRAAASSDADFDPGSPSGIAMLRREHEPAPVYISIDVGSVLLSAFDRANESLTEGAVDGGVE